MPNQTGSTDTDLRPKPLSPDAVWDRVDPLAADCGTDPADTNLVELPYFTLRGPGFERLVYELLQAENKRPWFFGRTGQPQYGVDIVTEAAGQQTIYQCKNYAEARSFRFCDADDVLGVRIVLGKDEDRGDEGAAEGLKTWEPCTSQRHARSLASMC